MYAYVSRFRKSGSATLTRKCPVGTGYLRRFYLQLYLGSATCPLVGAVVVADEEGDVEVRM